MGGIRCGIAALMLAVGLSGCQCCCLFERYADEIDRIATDECCLDAFYCPCLDLTRIGRPDWCQCGFNRLLCPCACARCKPLPHIMEPIPDYYLARQGYHPNSPARSSDAPDQADAKDAGNTGNGRVESLGEPEITPPIFELQPPWPNRNPPSAPTR